MHFTNNKTFFLHLRRIVETKKVGIRMEKTLVWAHRGACAYAPENTLVAFQKAIEMGADGIELDVQMTKDGELVVVHDETLERVSDGTGWVQDYTYTELKQFNFNKNFPEYGEVTLPTLEEIYLLIKPTNLTINVEIKTGIVFYEGIEQRVIDLTERFGLENRVIYSSFNHMTLRKIKELRPHVPVGMLYSDGLVDVLDYAEHVIKADALHPAYYNLQFPNVIEDAKKKGKPINVWTVNDEMEMRFLCERQIHAMITNDPALGRKIADEYCNGVMIPELVQKICNSERKIHEKDSV